MSKMDIYSQYISRQQHLSENSLISGQKLISEREIVINRLMAEGFTSKQIENLLNNYFQLNEDENIGWQTFNDGSTIRRYYGRTIIGVPGVDLGIDGDHHVIRDVTGGKKTPDIFIAGRTPGGQSSTDGSAPSAIKEPAPRQQTPGSTGNAQQAGAIEKALRLSASRPTARTTSAVGSRAIYGPVADMIPPRPPTVAGPGGEMAGGKEATQFTKKEIEQTRKEADAARQTKTQSDPGTKAKQVSGAKASARPSKASARPRRASPAKGDYDSFGNYDSNKLRQREWKGNKIVRTDTPTDFTKTVFAR